MGPGPSSYTVVRWTVPSRGDWDIVGQFFGTGPDHRRCPYPAQRISLFNSPVNGSATASFSLTLKLSRGDTMDFEAGRTGGNNDADPTGFNATITPEL